MLSLVVLASAALAQYTPGGPTQAGLPAGCVGSYPDIPRCQANNWYIPDADPCYPLTTVPMPGAGVSRCDEFLHQLPNPNSIVMQNNYYNQSKLPTIVQAEGYVQSFCMGDYLPPGSLPLAKYGVRSAAVIKSFVPGSSYFQIAGTLDCARLGINCTMSAPGAYDDGGQYDNGGYAHCGKEPYSGVDSSAKGNAGFVNYVEMAGNGLFCMRVCEAGTMVAGGVCDVTRDTAGCAAVMGVSSFGNDGEFSYYDQQTGAKTTTTISLPPKTTTTTAAATASSTAAVSTDASGKVIPPANNGKSSAAGLFVNGVVIAAAITYIL
ncbi:hypothetical protein BCR33DRAFT_712771 [Rhizoclosmatium globosum]|uniref:Uncharacterized protein n=1 Tax=Rhizoclosmatium globosum TaxID=329046 RepID=A0A1Y2CUR9_9FUNG|nr:hypothetical protein BCR33DRAFT_712771 [Rhizoclosmatium globosum]|eukprot:ORY50788.1 hypothetical protein BCR33DRAFT_712771 [Rhizoclosmatium globosum]